MKIIHFKIFALFSFLVVLTACSEDELPPNLNKTPKLESHEFTVMEDAPSGYVLGSLTASDPDGDVLTFSVAKNDNNLFSLSSKGELALAQDKTLDFESAEEHTLKVTVSDGDRQMDADVTIKVINVIDTKAEEPESFVTTWITKNDNETIIIGTNPNLEYNFLVDWGDGNVSEAVTVQNPAHKYEKAGKYQVVIQGNFPAIVMNNSDSFSRSALLSIDKWGTKTWQSFERSFMGCSKMVYKANDAPDLSEVKNLSYMFTNAKLFNADLSVWNVSNVVNMSAMFANAANFNGDISTWDVSNVTDMSFMFQNAESFNGNIDGWVVDNVAKMQYMFTGASSFSGNLAEWNVSNVNNMEAMFASAKSFNGDISGWEIPNVTNLFGMFVDALAFDRSLGDWHISDVGNMEQMLNGCGMSRESYEATLIGWSNLADNLGLIMGPRTLGAAGLEYCSEEGILAHDNLINTHGWTINGDSQQCN